VDGDASSTRLVIVGDGEERERLERLARELGIDLRVTFAGAQPHETVALYLAAADGFRFPTERDEASGLVLLQAMACARPVAASRIGGITEVIGESGECGMLIPPGDVPALAHAMRTLVGDEGLRGRLGEAARDRVLAEYTIERMTERTLAVYEVARNRILHSSKT
jgi:glycosyltransferase involved in cell wall biosynthesis